MTLDVVGAGFGRTGTLSLKLALERLGFDKCYHMMEVFAHPEHVGEWGRAHRGETIDWDRLFAGYRAAVDWPACNFWRVLADFYPQSKVILSVREPNRWYESVMATIYPSTLQALADDDPGMRAWGRWADELIWQGVFDGRMDEKTHAIDVLRRHEASVSAAIPADRLLVFEAASGWAPLCEFLGVPVPDEPYPRVNTTEEFLARRRNTSQQS
jgi:hypothetical protein